MSIVSQRPERPQEARERREARRLAMQLTPLQRRIVALAGQPRWFGLPVPWVPSPGQHLAVARALASRDYGVLCPTPDFLGAYRLTRRGERVAGVWFRQALWAGDA